MPNDTPNTKNSSWHSLDTQTALQELTTQEQGLSSEFVKDRLQQYGFNRFSTKQQSHLLGQLVRQFNNRFVYILLLAAGLTTALQWWLDTGLILGVIVISSLLGLIQERRTAKTLAAVHHLLSPTAKVLRDNTPQVLPVEQLVPGDIVLLETGSQVPADLRLIHSDGLQLDEAILMGYSAPILKGISRLDAETALPDRSNMAYAGTLVLSGEGKGLVVATGAATELGKLNTLVSDEDSYTTPLSGELRRLINTLALVLLGAAVLIFLVAWLTPSVQGHNLQELLQATASLAVAVVPEGLPALLAIMLALSVNRLSKHKVIVRQLAAVETLGTVSVVCTDKTYTLTRNELTVQSIITPRGLTYLEGAGYDPQGEVIRAEHNETLEQDDRADLIRLAEAAVLTSDAYLKQVDQQWQVVGDALDGSLVVMAEKLGINAAEFRQNYQRLASIPFNRTYRYSAVLTEATQGGEQTLFIKGAPEAILTRCSHVQTDIGLEPLEQKVWEDRLKKLAEKGMKTLVIASRQPELPLRTLSHNDVGYGMVLLGLIGISDPPQESALAAVKASQAAGVKVKMLTGDHAVTASTLAKHVGIGDGKTVMTGAELDLLDNEALSTAAQTIDVFARLEPDQKLRLVKALQANGERVAMLGGGVNDAPALKQAEVGIAPNLSTEVARQSAGIVLISNQLSSLVEAAREGRRVLDNFYKMVLFMLPSNGAQATAIMVASLVGLALPLMPAQILWVNLLVTGLLAFTLAFEKAETRPQSLLPTNQTSTSLLSGFLVWRLISVSVILLVSLLGIFYWEIERGETLEAARTAAINTLVIGQIFYLLSVRHSKQPGWQWSSLRQNAWIFVAIALVLILQVLLTYFPAFQQVLGTDAIDFYAWFWIVAAGSLVFLVVEFEKGLQRNAKGWTQSLLSSGLQHLNPRFWKEKGLRWTLQAFLVIFVIVQAALMFYWSREPDTFDVKENARRMVGVSATETLQPGVVTTATLAYIANTLLDKPGGYLSNDVSLPSLIMDNTPNWELGVLTQVRDMSLAMRDDLSRSQSQSAADPDLVKAQLRFNTDGKLWLFPPAETQYREGAESLESYLQRLQQGQAQFFARSDNLNNWLNKVQRQMGSLSIALASSVGVRQVKEEGAAMQRGDAEMTSTIPGIDLETEVLPAVDDPNEVIVKTPRLKVDDVFYQARGQTRAIFPFHKAIEVDFGDILQQKNALVSLRQIINKLEDTQALVWSPIILNGDGYSFVANHSLVMASQVSRANAALIDLGRLLREG